VDLFTCGDTCDPKVAYAYLKEKFMANSAIYSELKRGLVPASAISEDGVTGVSKEFGEVLKMPFIVSHEENTGDSVELTPELRFSNLSHEVINQELVAQDLVGGTVK
jgi:hypothetical protein